MSDWTYVRGYLSYSAENPFYFFTDALLKDAIQKVYKKEVKEIINLDVHRLLRLCNCTRGFQYENSDCHVDALPEIIFKDDTHAYLWPVPPTPEGSEGAAIIRTFYDCRESAIWKWSEDPLMFSHISGALRGHMPNCYSAYIILWWNVLTTLVNGEGCLSISDQPWMDALDSFKYDYEVDENGDIIYDVDYSDKALKIITTWLQMKLDYDTYKKGQIKNKEKYLTCHDWVYHNLNNYDYTVEQTTE